MTTTPRHPLVKEYLDQLRRCAERLPRDEREDLITELHAHVDAGALEARSEAEIRNMLDALGTPEEIVAAAAREGIPTESVTGPTGRLALTFGVLALVMLLIPFLFFLAVPFGIAAVELGRRARRFLRSTGQPTSISTAGAATGGAAVVIVVMLFTLLVAGRSSESPEPANRAPSDAPTTTGTGG